MSRPLLLATDLDRTLIPNGPEPEAAGARERFAALCARAEVTLAYVSGRDVGRIRAAIREWSLPAPDAVIADVGTSVWWPSPGGDRSGDWRRDSRWDGEIGAGWGDGGGDRVRGALSGVRGLALQGADRQGPWKASFVGEGGGGSKGGADGVREAVDEVLAGLGLPVRAIWSVDQVAHEVLLDVLPHGASKRHALTWLHEALGIAAADVVFAGDSGNDLEVMGSGLASVLVGNARDAVKAAARAASAGTPEQLHLASACYADGILEGVHHSRPDLARARAR